jgi:hypothetical protein
VTIFYRHPLSINPPWFAGWAPFGETDVAVCHRDTAEGCIVGIGNPVTFSPSPSAGWVDAGDGWEASLGLDFDPRLIIRRSQRWADVSAVRDMRGWGWAVPTILNRDGGRAFRVAYGGPDMLPVLTDEQTRCLAVARAARDEMVAAKSRETAGDSSEAGIDASVAARWVLPFIAAANHISEIALSALGLLDDFLVVGALSIGTGLPLKR